MINYTDSKLDKIIVHKIGNKTEDEGIRFSNSKLSLQGEFIEDLLLQFFLRPFKNESFFQFYHDADINLNESFSFVSKIFENEDIFEEQSKNLAKHLYEQSFHPKIKSGEFYTVFIKNCMIDDEIVDAVGLFKTENKDTYLKVEERNRNFEIDYEEGININKIDKACIIYNTEKSDGYVINIVDNINKSKEAQYWKDDFLKIKQREDNYYFTQNYLTMCKTFVEKGFEDLEKSDQIELKNDTIKYFAEKDNFNIAEFEHEVIANDEVIEVFREFKTTYEEAKEIKLEDDFEISDNAVKKSKNKFKSVIKLDKNFHIYIHGKRELIEKGFDTLKNKNFYKLFFDEEK